MVDQPQFSAVLTSEHKRRKVEIEPGTGQIKVDRARVIVTDRAKANYVRCNVVRALHYAYFVYAYNMRSLRSSMAGYVLNHLSYVYICRPECLI